MRKKLLLIIAGLQLLLIAAGAVAWRHYHVSELIEIGTGYTAQQTCACLFISRRALDSCRRDLDPLAKRFIGILPGEDQVTAVAIGLFHTTARYEPPFGCTLKD